MNLLMISKEYVIPFFLDCLVVVHERSPRCMIAIYPPTKNCRGLSVVWCMKKKQELTCFMDKFWILDGRVIDLFR